MRGQVYVAEPSAADTVQILRGIADKYATFHGVRVHDRALVAAAELSERYIQGRFREWLQTPCVTPDCPIQTTLAACISAACKGTGSLCYACMWHQPTQRDAAWLTIPAQSSTACLGHLPEKGHGCLRSAGQGDRPGR